MLKPYDIVYIRTSNGTEKDYVVEINGPHIRLLLHNDKIYHTSDFLCVVNRKPLSIGTKVTILDKYKDGTSVTSYPYSFTSDMLELYAGQTVEITDVHSAPRYAVSYCKTWGDQFDGYIYRLNNDPEWWWTTPMFNYKCRLPKIKVPEHKININLC